MPVFGKASTAAATAADWLAAVGTVGAFLVALVLLAWQLRESQRARAAARRDQASKVAAWIEGDGPHFEIVIKNGSAYPVYHVVFRVNEADVTVEDEPPGVLTQPLGPEFTRRLPYFSEGQSLRAVELWFQDNAGVNWHRAPGGNGLAEADPPGVGC